jgi:hypothetical protein
MIGLDRTDSTNNTFQLAGLGQLNGPTALSGTGSATLSTNLTTGNWYQVSFDLTFNLDSGTPADSTITVEDLAVRDWGTNGLTGGTTVMSLASTTFNPGFGTNLNTDANAYAVVAGNGGRVGQYLDNISITAIPEPSSLALALVAGLGILRQCAAGNNPSSFYRKRNPVDKPSGFFYVPRPFG